MPPAEGLALFEIAAVYARIGPVAEIGTYCGKSTIYLAAAGAAGRAAGRDGGPPPRLGGEPAGLEYHDPALVDPATGGSTRCRTSGLPSRPPAWRSTSSPWSAGPRRGRAVAAPLGMLFIDGGHTDAAAQADYEGWAPWVAPGGGARRPRCFPRPGGWRPAAVPGLPPRAAVRRVRRGAARGLATGAGADRAGHRLSVPRFRCAACSRGRRLTMCGRLTGCRSRMRRRQPARRPASRWPPAP